MAKRYYNLEKETKAYLKACEDRGIVNQENIKKINDYVINRKVINLDTSFLSNNPVILNGLQMWVDSTVTSSYNDSPTIWNDLSPSINNGTLTNGTKSVNRLMTFDGINDSVNFSSGVVNNTYTELTVEVMFRTTTSSAQCLIENGTGFTTNSFYLFQENSTQLTFLVYGTNYNVRFCSTTYSPNTWYHLVGTWKSNEAPNVYLNGVLSNGTLQGAIQTTLRNGDANLHIGLRPISSFPFSGSIPIARIYNRALNSREVLQNYNAQKSRFGL